METWFLASLIGATLAGVSNFFFKMAASRGYNAEIYSLYGALIASILMGFGSLFFAYSISDFNTFTVIMLVSGMTPAMSFNVK